MLYGARLLNKAKTEASYFPPVKCVLSDNCIVFVKYFFQKNKFLTTEGDITIHPGLLDNCHMITGLSKIHIEFIIYL